jgi:hypothetical protein
MEVMMTEKPALNMYEPKPTSHATQEMMRQYRQLKQQQREIEGSINELRQVLSAARTFEDGSLKCNFEIRTSPLLCYAVAMAKVLDPMVLNELLWDIECMEYTEVLIEETVPGETGG